MPTYLDTPDLFLVVNDARLHYLDWGGPGQPLLFLPGIGEPASVFKWFAPRFLPGFRPIALTRRGTGKSQIIPGTYQLGQLTDDVWTFVQRLGLGPVTVVGHSYGGFELVRLASAHPSLLRTAIFLDAVYSPEYVALLPQDPVPGPQPPTLPRTALRSLHDYFSYIRAAYPFTDKEWSLPTEDAWAVDVEIASDGELREIDRGTVLSDMIASVKEELLDYSRIPCPVLAIEAFEDQHPNLPPAASAELREKADEYQRRENATKHAALERLRQQKPDARIVTVSDAPHHLYITHSDQVYSYMAEFLATHAELRSA